MKKILSIVLTAMSLTMISHAALAQDVQGGYAGEHSLYRGGGR